MLKMNEQAFDFLAQVEKLKRAATQVCGTVWDPKGSGARVRIDNYLSEFYDRVLADSKDPGKMAAQAEFIKAARRDPKVAAQLCAIRVRTINNYLIPTMTWAPFFCRFNDLKDDERPVLQNETKQQIFAGKLGIGGEPLRTEVVKPQTEVIIPLDFISSNEALYNLVDINLGKLADVAKKTFDIVFDLANQEEILVFKALTSSVANGGVFGAFTFNDPTGVLNVYVPNTRVRTANLPSTNDIVLSDNGTGGGQSNSFRYSCFAQAKQYSSQWTGAFFDKKVELTGRVKVAGQEIAALAAAIVPTGQTRNRVADELLEQGYTRVDYLGTQFTLEVDNTINPGASYFEIREKCADVYHKPGLDEEYVNDTQEYKRKNQEGRWVRKVFGISTNSAERIFALRIQHSSTYDVTNP